MTACTFTYIRKTDRIFIKGSLRVFILLDNRK